MTGCTMNILNYLDCGQGEHSLHVLLGATTLTQHPHSMSNQTQSRNRNSKGLIIIVGFRVLLVHNCDFSNLVSLFDAKF